MPMLTIDDVDLKGKRVLVRVDYNVPIVDGKIVDKTRIEESLPTIRKVSANAVCLLMAHLGRPKRKSDESSLRIVAGALSEMLGKQVRFLEDFDADISTLRPGGVALYENLRFHPGEESNSDDFARLLAKGKDVYVNDGFSVSHRKHASVHAVTKYVPVSCAGYSLVKELESLGRIMHNPDRPFALVFGGAKVSDKIPLIRNLLDKVDMIIIGGAVANTFLAAQGKKVGASLVEREMLGEAAEIAKIAAARGVELVYPRDFAAAKELKAGVAVQIVSEVPEGLMAGDIGPESVKLFNSKLARARTVFWNGPMGVYEILEFASGSKKVAEYLAGSAAFTVAGGGDVVGAISSFGLKNKFKHVSTGGGACLEFLGGDELPGISALHNLP